MGVGLFCDNERKPCCCSGELGECRREVCVEDGGVRQDGDDCVDDERDEDDTSVIYEDEGSANPIPLSGEIDPGLVMNGEGRP